MADKYDLSDLGGTKYDLSDLGSPAPSGAPESAAQPASLRDLAITLAHHIFNAAPESGLKQAIQSGSDVISQPVELGKGVVSGLKRQPFDTEQTFSNQFGQAVGTGAIPMAAAVGASMAAPAVVPAAVAAAPLLTSAAASGIGAGLGDLASMGVSKALGGNAPDTMGEAVSAAGKTGLMAAATDLGVGGAMKAVTAAAPRIVSMFKSFPKEGLKRILSRPDEVLDILKGAKNPQKSAEEAAVQALREVQNGLTMARTDQGKAVGAALEEFQKVTEGKPIINSFEISQAGADALANRSTSEGISAISDSEIRKLSKVMKDLDKQGPMNARDAVIWRQKLDNLIDYKKGAVPEITSGQGQGIVAQMAKTLRDQIQAAAEKAGFTQLAEANAKFSKTATAYDAYRPAFNTKTALGGEAVKRLKALEGAFNEGGLAQADLTEIGHHIPILQGPVDRLLDAMVARRLTLESAGSQSGVPMTAIRFLAGPDGLSTALNALRGKTAAVRRGATGLGAGVASKLNQGPVKPR